MLLQSYPKYLQCHLCYLGQPDCKTQKIERAHSRRVSYKIYSRELCWCNHLTRMGMMACTWICLVLVLASSSTLAALFIFVFWLSLRIEEWLLLNLLSSFECSA